MSTNTDRCLTEFIAIAEKHLRAHPELGEVLQWVKETRSFPPGRERRQRIGAAFTKIPDAPTEGTEVMEDFLRLHALITEAYDPAAAASQSTDLSDPIELKLYDGR